MQGWAVVDNTVGADWDNVQLSLVAGAPQSFIQPLSQPLYSRRPEIPIATLVETTPQTHEAANSQEFDKIELAAKIQAPPRVNAGPMAGAVAPMHGQANALAVQADSNVVSGLISGQQVSNLATQN